MHTMSTTSYFKNVHRYLKHGGRKNINSSLCIQETNEMIEKENLDVRTITLGISLLDCIVRIWMV